MTYDSMVYLYVYRSADIFVYTYIYDLYVVCYQYLLILIYRYFAHRRQENVKNILTNGSGVNGSGSGNGGDIDIEMENEEDDCAICMNTYVDSLPIELLPYTPNRVYCGLVGSITLLNCSHMFHEQCITNFEKFTPYAVCILCIVYCNSKYILYSILYILL